MFDYITCFFNWLWDVIINFIYSSIQLGFVLFWVILAIFVVCILVYSAKVLLGKDDKDAGQADN